MTIKNAVRWMILMSFACFVFALPAGAANAPHEIAGIALGTSVDDYPDIVRTNYLQEVVVTDWHGFRKGIISYGTCKYIDQILKIDMKYEDRDEEFYEKLLREFRQKFGEPTSWNGDSFGVMRIWKWQFIDNEQNRVSLSLQYNSKNSNETIGNVVKLAYPERMVEEQRCFAEMCQQSKINTDEKRKEELRKSDWSHLIPR